MPILLYGALIVAQTGTCVKAYSMKRCGQITPGPFNSICINLARSFICVLVSLFIWLISDGQTTTPMGYAIIIIAGIGTALNLFSWILATRVVPLILIEAVSTVGSMVIPLILSPYLYGEDAVTPVQWIGALLICISVLFFVGKDNAKKEECPLITKIILLFVCASGVTLASVGKKYYTFNISAAGLGSAEYFTFMGFVAVLLFFSIFFALFYAIEKKRISTTGEQKKVELPYKKVWMFIVAAAIALYVAELFGTYASGLPSTIYYPGSRVLNIISFFLLDVIFYKDKVTAKKLIGLGILLIGIILVNI